MYRIHYVKSLKWTNEPLNRAENIMAKGVSDNYEQILLLAKFYQKSAVEA